MTGRLTCRMLSKYGDRCTAEAIDPDGEVVICARHAAAVMRLVAEQAAAAGVPLMVPRDVA